MKLRASVVCIGLSLLWVDTVYIVNLHVYENLFKECFLLISLAGTITQTKAANVVIKYYNGDREIFSKDVILEALSAKTLQILQRILISLLICHKDPWILESRYVINPCIQPDIRHPCCHWLSMCEILEMVTKMLQGWVHNRQIYAGPVKGINSLIHQCSSHLNKQVWWSSHD